MHPDAMINPVTKNATADPAVLQLHHKHEQAQRVMRAVSPYDVLGVARDSSMGAIRAAFLTLAKMVHPDKNDGSQLWKDAFHKCHEAFATLSSPHARADYDRSTARGAEPTLPRSAHTLPLWKTQGFDSPDMPEGWREWTHVGERVHVRDHPTADDENGEVVLVFGGEITGHHPDGVFVEHRGPYHWSQVIRDDRIRIHARIHAYGSIPVMPRPGWAAPGVKVSVFSGDDPLHGWMKGVLSNSRSKFAFVDPDDSIGAQRKHWGPYCWSQIEIRHEPRRKRRLVDEMDEAPAAKRRHFLTESFLGASRLPHELELQPSHLAGFCVRQLHRLAAFMCEIGNHDYDWGTLLHRYGYPLSATDAELEDLLMKFGGPMEYLTQVRDLAVIFEVRTVARHLDALSDAIKRFLQQAEFRSPAPALPRLDERPVVEEADQEQRWKTPRLEAASAGEAEAPSAGEDDDGDADSIPDSEEEAPSAGEAEAPSAGEAGDSEEDGAEAATATLLLKMPHGVYQGGLFGSKRHGKGSMKYKNSSRYEGEWQNGKKHGGGEMTYADSDVYDVYMGSFTHGKRDGQGTMAYTDGGEYEGAWKRGLRHGRGKMTHGRNVDGFRAGDTYEGEWDKGEIHGRGSMMYQDGDEYEGEWDKQKMHGRGRMKFQDGDVYEGLWQNQEMHGQGRMYYKVGKVYEGEWKHHQMHGQGTMTYSNGVYVGTWEHDQERSGKMTYQDGNVYEGDWQNGKENGRGKAEYVNGDVYEGLWKDGKPHGRGNMKYKDGDVYDGEWEAKWSHGQGTMSYANGDLFEGVWKMGWPLRGTMTHSNLDVYEGEMKNMERHGRGKVTYSNGDVFEGVWKKGKRGTGTFTPAQKTHKDHIDALVDKHIRDLDLLVLRKVARQLPQCAVDVTDLAKCREQLRTHPELAFSNQTVQVADEMLKFLVRSARLAVVAERELEAQVKALETLIDTALCLVDEDGTLSKQYELLLTKLDAAAAAGLQDTSDLHKRATSLCFVLKLHFLQE